MIDFQVWTYSRWAKRYPPRGDLVNRYWKDKEKGPGISLGGCLEKWGKGQLPTAEEMAWLFPSCRSAVMTGGPIPSLSFHAACRNNPVFKDLQKDVLESVKNVLSGKETGDTHRLFEMIQACLLEQQQEELHQEFVQWVRTQKQDAARVLEQKAAELEVVTAPLLYHTNQAEVSAPEVQKGSWWLIATREDGKKEQLEPVEIYSRSGQEVIYQYMMAVGSQFLPAWYDPKDNKLVAVSRSRMRRAKKGSALRRYQPWHTRENVEDFLQLVEDRLTKDKEAGDPVLPPEDDEVQSPQSQASDDEAGSGREEFPADQVQATLTSPQQLKVEKETPETQGIPERDLLQQLLERHKKMPGGRDQLRRAQLRVTSWRSAIEILEGIKDTNVLAEDPNLLKLVKHSVMVKGLLCLRDKDGTARIRVPTELRAPIIWAYHSSRMGGHVGPKKLMPLLRYRFYWKGMRKDVYREVGACACRLTNGVRRKRIPLKPRFGTPPLQVVTMDIYGPLPLSHSGNNCVISISDVGSRWPEFAPRPDATARTVAMAFINSWVLRHGLPLAVISDQGPQFRSAFFKTVMEVLGVEVRLVVVGRHQANPIERVHRTLGAMLRLYVGDDQRDWDEHLPFIAFAIRAYAIGVLDASPFELLKGQRPRLPGDTWLDEMELYRDGDEWLHKKAKELRWRLLRFQEREQKEAVGSAARYQRLVAPHPEGALQVGQEVARLITNTSRKGLAAKLKPGPFVRGYTLIKKCGQGILQLRHNQTGRIVDVSEDDVRPLHDVLDSDFAREVRRTGIASLDWRAASAEAQEVSSGREEDDDIYEPAGPTIKEVPVAEGDFVLHKGPRRSHPWSLGKVVAVASPEARSVSVHLWENLEVDPLTSVHKPVWQILDGKGCQRFVDFEANLPAGSRYEADVAVVLLSHVLRYGFQLDTEGRLQKPERSFLRPEGASPEVSTHHPHA